MLIFAIPIIFLTPQILTLWLKNYPQDAVIFVQLTLVYSMITVLSTPLTTIILATGQIRSNALIIGGLRLMILPLSYIVLSIGYPAYSVYFVLIFIDSLSIFTRLYILKSIIGIGLMGYMKEVFGYVSLVTIIVVPINYLIIVKLTGSVPQLLLYAVFSFICTIITVAFMGLTRKEKCAIKNLQKKLLKNKKVIFK